MAFVKLKPALKHYLWGGRKLIDHYHVQASDQVAEAWVVSAHPDGPSIVEDSGQTFVEYLQEKGSAVLGENGRRFETFPILIKLLDSKQDLSIQVHPDNEYALKHEGEYGKNEMWLILQTDENACIYYGVSHDMEKHDFKKILENGEVMQHLHKIETKPYDFFYIPAGTIHALGAGNVMAEVQQSSNSTYRIYDFDRIDRDGQKRELHIDKAIDVSNLTPMPTAPVFDFDQSETTLLKNEYFYTRLFKVHGELAMQATDESFQALLVLKGSGKIDVTPLKIGDAIFVEANTKYTLSGDMDVLVVAV